MADDCTPVARADCPEVLAATCPEWKLCLPFGASLESRGGCIYMVAGSPPPDGTYGKFVLKGGCITDALPEDVALYTGPTCAPTPNPCGGGAGGGVEISTVEGNLITTDPAGKLLALLYVKGGSGISVSGDGTEKNPLVITATGGSSSGGVYVISGNKPITVSGDGSAKTPYKISHYEQAEALTIQGMSFDKYGHLQGYTPVTGNKGLTGIIGKDGVTVNVDVNTGIATVSLTPSLPEVSGTFLLGGYAVTLTKNKITNVTQQIKFPAGKYNLGPYEATINEYGSLTAITRKVTFPAGSYDLGDYRVTVNEYGTLTGIQKLPEQQPKSTTTRFSKMFEEFDSDGDSTSGARTITFDTDVEASFRITYQLINTGSFVPPEGAIFDKRPSIKVDGRVYASLLTLENRIDCITTARFAPGRHVVGIDFSNAGWAVDYRAILDVTLAEWGE